MNVSADEIERIVRDVMSRLASERTSTAKQDVVAKPEIRVKQAAPAANELMIDDRVVSLEALRGRLSGIVRVSVGERAIVTPAVRDLLREKKVGLVRRTVAANSASAAAVRTIVVAAAETKVDVSGVVRELRAEGCKVEQLAQAGLASAVRELGDEVERSGAVGLLVTDEPDVALVALNRRSGVRAVGGDDAATIERAARAVGANVYVVRGSRVGGIQIKRWLVPAARQATSAPEKFRELLK